MKYMLIMSGTKAEFESYASWPKEDLSATVTFMRSFAQDLEERGVLVLTEGLGFSEPESLRRDWRRFILPRAAGKTANLPERNYLATPVSSKTVAYFGSRHASFSGNGIENRES